MAQVPSGCPEDAIFSLIPSNDKGTAVLELADNQHLAWTTLNGDLALAICLNTSPNDDLIATMGRGCHVDIVVQDPAVSKLQCKFKMFSNTGVIMLYDKSNSQTTHLVCDQTLMFQPGRPRRAVLWSGVETEIRIGNPFGTYIGFELYWHRGSLEMITEAERKPPRTKRLGNPRLAPTRDEAGDAEGSRYPTRIHTPHRNNENLTTRYYTIQPLGSGSFGCVDKVVNIDTGALVAVKKVPMAPIGSAGYQLLKREVQALAHCKHEHIVNFISSEIGLDGVMRIFTGLKEGSLSSLVEDVEKSANPSFPRLLAITKSALIHMLKALHFLSTISLIHRDVKPENILYTTLPGGQGYHFQLGDFGLCNVAASANTVLGSPPYMAPEMHDHTIPKTCKVDVWSLFVTIIWALDFQGYRKNGYLAEPYNRWAILEASRHAQLEHVGEMAMEDPTARASAADVLAKFSNGRDHTTPTRRNANLLLGTVAIAEPSYRIRAVPSAQHAQQQPPMPYSNTTQHQYSINTNARGRNMRRGTPALTTAVRQYSNEKAPYPPASFEPDWSLEDD